MKRKKVILTFLLLIILVFQAAALDSTVINIGNIYDLTLSRSNLVKSNDVAITLLDGTSTGTYLDSAQTIHQMTNANYQIAASAQQLLLSYYSTSNQLTQMTNSLNTMKRKITMLKKMAELGLMSQSDLDAAKLTLSDLENSKTALENACGTLKGQIGVFIGYDADGFTVEDLAVETKDDLRSLRSEINLRTYGTAYYNSYDIYIAQRAYDLAETARNSGTISTARKEGYALEYTKAGHKAAYSSQKADALLKLDQLLAAMDTYEHKEEVFQAASKKYELGMISQFAYEDAKDQLAIDYTDVVSAQIEFLKSYETFVTFVDKGVWLTGSSS